MGEKRESRGWGREIRWSERERERDRGDKSVCERSKEPGMGEERG